MVVSLDGSSDCFQNATLNAVPKVGTFTSFKWYQGNNLVGTTQNVQFHSDTYGNIPYTLIASTADGCVADSTKSIFIEKGVTADELQIPNVITRNGDGVNDEILMPLMDNDCINYKVQILNRWGNLVYEADKQNPSFKGQTKTNHDLAPGTYFYHIVTKDFDCSKEPFKTKCSGFITIIE